MKLLIPKKEIIKFVKFNIVGLMNTTIDFSVFFLLASIIRLPVIPAQLISYSMGIINSYFMNRFWTFQIKKASDKKEFSLFVIVNLVALIISTVLIYILSKLIEYIMVAKVIVTLFVMVINFLGQRLIIFKSVNDEVELGIGEIDDEKI